MEYERPSVYVENWFDSILNKLVDSHYGTAMQLLNTPTDIVMGHLHYLAFKGEYQVQLLEMIKK